MLLLAFATALADSRALLFIGNSYTMAGNLEQVTLGMFVAGAPTESDLAQRVATPGYTLPMHLADADGTHGDTPARDALVTGTQAWDWVILQDQSQIPGFPDDNAEYLASLAAVPPLDTMIAAKGGQTVFLMTWGRRAGDDTNPDLYPDFLTMQGKLAAGYEHYAAAVTTPERPAWVAPAGYGFQHIYAAEVAAGENPLDEASLFYRLYQPDGSHPSTLGTYLAGCVVYATITGDSCVGLPAPPELAADDVAALQDAGDAAVFRESPELSYPWQGGGDTGGADTGADTGATDTGSGDSGADSAVDADSAPDGGTGGNGDSAVDAGSADPEGCGCESAPGGPGFVTLGVLVLLSTRRRSAR